jgi:hypothetical protein
MILFVRGSILLRKSRGQQKLLGMSITSNVFLPTHKESVCMSGRVRVGRGEGTQNMNATSERCQDDPPKEEKKRVSSSSNLMLVFITLEGV